MEIKIILLKHVIKFEIVRECQETWISSWYIYKHFYIRLLLFSSEYHLINIYGSFICIYIYTCVYMYKCINIYIYNLNTTISWSRNIICRCFEKSILMITMIASIEVYLKHELMCAFATISIEQHWKVHGNTKPQIIQYLHKSVRTGR